MSEGGRGRILAVAFIWLVLAAAAAALYRFALQPMFAARSDLEAAVEEWRTVAEEARTRKVSFPDLPEEADAETVERMTADLKLAITGTGLAGGEAKVTLRLAIDSFSGYAILRSEALARNLRARGIGLELVDDGADYTRRFEALRRGATPLAVFTVDALLEACARAGSRPATIVMVIDETVGADAMVAWESGAAKIDDLNRPEARFVVTPGSPSETLARVVMASFDLGALPADPFIAEDGAAKVYARFLAADRTEPRGYVLWEPYVSKALEEPGAKILIDSGHFRGYIVDVLVAQRDFLLRHEREVGHLVEAYLQALHDATSDPPALARLVRDDARAGGEPISDAQAAALVERVWWKNTRENYAHFGLVSEGGLPTLDRVITGLVTVLTRTGALAADPTGGEPGSLYYDRIFRGLLEAGFHPGAGPGGRAEEIRAEAAAEPLSDAEWEELVPVGTAGVDRLVFARGTDRLTGLSERALDDLARTLDSFPHYFLEVRGHAATIGDAEANRQLASARAAAARDHLARAGVPAARLRAVAAPPRSSAGSEQSVSFVLGQRPY